MNKYIVFLKNYKIKIFIVLIFCVIQSFLINNLIISYLNNNLYVNYNSDLIYFDGEDDYADYINEYNREYNKTEYKIDLATVEFNKSSSYGLKQSVINSISDKNLAFNVNISNFELGEIFNEQNIKTPLPNLNFKQITLGKFAVNDEIMISETLALSAFDSLNYSDVLNEKLEVNGKDYVISGIYEPLFKMEEDVIIAAGTEQKYFEVLKNESCEGLNECYVLTDSFVNLKYVFNVLKRIIVTLTFLMIMRKEIVNFYQVSIQFNVAFGGFMLNVIIMLIIINLIIV